MILKKIGMYIVFALCLLLVKQHKVQAQTSLNNTGVLYFSKGSYITIAGNFNNCNKGRVYADTTLYNGLYVGGNVSNTADSVLNFANVKTTFFGADSDSITGTQTIQFSRMDINKHSSTTTVNVFQPISISDTMSLTQGIFDLRNDSVNLLTTGLLYNENNTNYVMASDGEHNGYGYGTISATRTLKSDENTNIAGLGVDILCGNYAGTRTITRGHRIQRNVNGENPSIKRYVQLPDFPAISENAIIVLHFLDQELNGFTPEEISLFRNIVVVPVSKQAQLRDAASDTTWVEVVTLVNTDNAPQYSATSQGSYNVQSGTSITGGNIFTGSLYSNFLPIELTAFTVDCAPAGNTLRWTTATETRNDYFTLERSFDGVHFDIIAEIPGAGTSTRSLNYSVYDAIEGEKLAYYRLSQTDYNGTTQEFDVISTHCQFSYQIYVINYHSVAADFYAEESSPYSLSIYDLLGERVASLSGTSTEGFNHVEIPNLKLHTGTYIADLSHNGITQTQKLYLH
ncbi:MAG: T9SS type A sorting domain-containing protein [Bacteroidales bacterium]|jgi:hypothetical protein|nr:T9SS type A sorting domain-containing protein [Bacteroidales bacterium]